MTALVTSAVTLVTVLFSLLSMDSMFRAVLAAEIREVRLKTTQDRLAAQEKKIQGSSTQ